MSPFKSEKQRRYLHANHPKLAERWEHKEKKGSSRPQKPKSKGKKK